MVPNSGLRVNLTGYSSFTPLASNASFQAAGEEAVGNYSAVFGLFQNNLFPPTAIFFIFSNVTNQVVVERSWPTLSIIPDESYDFAFQDYQGTTWELTVNGQPFGGNLTGATFDFGAPTCTWAARVLFSEVAFYGTTSPVPSLLTVPLALAVRLSSGWYLPTTGWSQYFGAPTVEWGAQGRIQHGSLAPGELETGQSIPSASSLGPSAVWTGGRIPVSVTMSVNPSSSASLSTAQAAVGVADVTGAPIPGVSVYLSDEGRSIFSPSTVGTNGSGSGFGYFITPNVTQPASDLVTGTVTLFGYTGASSQAISLTPAQQILVLPDSENPTVVPGQNLTLGFTTENAMGKPAANVILSFQAFGEGFLDSTQGVSDSNGHVSVGLLAPLTPATVTVLALVASQGAWGRSSVTVEVEAPPASFWSSYGIYVLLGALAALLVGVVWLSLRRSRRRAKPMPELPLREYLRARKRAEENRSWRAPGDTDEPDRSPTRTPPGSGNP